MDPTQPNGAVQPTLDMLDRYLAGHGTPAEDALVRSVLTQLPRVEETLRGVEQYAVPPGDTEDAMEHQASWERVRDSIARAQRSEAAARSRTRRGIGIAAAGAVVVALIGFALSWFGRDTIRSHTHTYQTAIGQRATIQLADGSRMTLAPATTVRVTPDVVMVSGEAYFSIAPHASHAFSVSTSHALVRVLGTTFAVRQYADERETRVVVEGGKVAVLSRGSRPGHQTAAIVSPAMMAQVTDSGVTVSSGVDTRAFIGWVHGTLVFDRVQLREVAAELSRAYGVSIRVPDSVLAARRVGLEVAVAERPLTRVLTLLAGVTGSHYTFDGNAYVILPGGRMAPTNDGAPKQHDLPQPEKLYGK